MTRPWRNADAEDKGLGVDPLIEVLADDPDAVPDLYVVVGLVGHAARNGHWRIYLNYELTEYLEVAEADIVLAAPAGEDQTRVWIEHGAAVRHIVQRPTRAERQVVIASRRAGAQRTVGPADEGYLAGPLAEWGQGLDGDDDDGGPIGSGCRCSLKQSR